MAIESYKNLITSQHKVQPKFMAWLSSALAIADDGMETATDIPADFDVDSAVGAQLDILGVIVGRGRELNFQPSGGEAPVLDDANFRTALKAKIAQNQWDGTIPQIYDIWVSLFPDLDLKIVDNQNMTMAAIISGQIDPIITEMVASGYIIPKPVGVGLTIIGASEVSENVYFGALVSGMDFVTVSTVVP